MAIQSKDDLHKVELQARSGGQCRPVFASIESICCDAEFAQQEIYKVIQRPMD